MVEYGCELRFGSTLDNPCKKTRNRCSGCLLVFYCGRGCQLADWADHRHVCACARAAAQLLRGDCDSRAVCQAALEALAEIPPGIGRLNAATSLMLAQLSHERPHSALMEVAERELDGLALVAAPAAALAAALLQIVRARTVLEYEWKNTRTQRCELEHYIGRLECSAAAAVHVDADVDTDADVAVRAAVDAATRHFINFSVSYLRSQFRPREQRRGLYWQALMQGRRYAESYRKLVAAGELAPRALYDIWNPLARILIRSRAQIMQYEHEFVEACREFTGSNAEPTDGIFETVAMFRRMVEEGVQFLTKGKNIYAVALLHWHTVVFYGKLAEATTSANALASLDAGRRAAARAGLEAARSIAHAPLTAVFEFEHGVEHGSESAY